MLCTPLTSAHATWQSCLHRLSVRPPYTLAGRHVKLVPVPRPWPNYNPNLPTVRGLWRRQGCTRLAILAHSMGNQILTRLLATLHTRAGPGAARVRDALATSSLAFAAPDVGMALFEARLNAYAMPQPRAPGGSVRVLYRSKRDLALTVSEVSRGREPLDEEELSTACGAMSARNLTTCSTATGYLPGRDQAPIRLAGKPALLLTWDPAPIKAMPRLCPSRSAQFDPRSALESSASSRTLSCAEQVVNRGQLRAGYRLVLSWSFETVDATRVRVVHPVGHGYFAQSACVVEDLRRVIILRQPAAQRLWCETGNPDGTITRCANQAHAAHYLVRAT